MTKNQSLIGKKTLTDQSVLICLIDRPSDNFTSSVFMCEVNLCRAQADGKEMYEIGTE